MLGYVAVPEVRLVGFSRSVRRSGRFAPTSCLSIISTQLSPALLPRFLSFPHHLTKIANCYIAIADCNMSLAEKLRYLRTIEGQLRGLDREMTQLEVVRAISREMKKSISQPYLSQIESG